MPWFDNSTKTGDDGPSHEAYNEHLSPDVWVASFGVSRCIGQGVPSAARIGQCLAAFV